MPAINPRVSVTLTPALDATLKRLSDVSGQSKSSIIAEILEQSQGVFERMAIIMETAKTATQEAKERMAANMEEAHSKLLEQAGVVADLFEEQTLDLVGELEQIGRRKSKGGGLGHGGSAAAHRAPGGTLKAAMLEAGSTPPVTRGSGTTVATPKKQGKTAAKRATARVGGRDA